MSRKQIIIIAVLVGFVLAEAVVFILQSRSARPALNQSPTEQVARTQAEQILGGTATSSPKQFAPEVPKAAPETKPQTEAPAAPGSSNKFNSYAITISASGFNPDMISVKKGTTVQLKLKAQGGTYDASIPYLGLYQKINPGEEKMITVTINTPGTYLIECRDFCPAGKKIKGELVVIP